jgi:dolichol kinase
MATSSAPDVQPFGRPAASDGVSWNNFPSVVEKVLLLFVWFRVLENFSVWYWPCVLLGVAGAWVDLYFGKATLSRSAGFRTMSSRSPGLTVGLLLLPTAMGGILQYPGSDRSRDSGYLAVLFSSLIGCSISTLLVVSGILPVHAWTVRPLRFDTRTSKACLTESGRRRLWAKQRKLDQRYFRSIFQSDCDKDVPLPGELWYIVDTQWLEHWRAFLINDHSHTSSSRNNDVPPPGPIVNDRLLLGCQGSSAPKPGLIKTIDYRGVSKRVWSELADRYGGGPAIIRQTMDIYDAHRSPKSETMCTKLSRLHLATVVPLLISVALPAMVCTILAPTGNICVYAMFIGVYQTLVVSIGRSWSDSFTLGEAMMVSQMLCMAALDFFMRAFAKNLQLLPHLLPLDRQPLAAVIELFILGFLLIGAGATCMLNMCGSDDPSKRASAYFAVVVFGLMAFLAIPWGFLDGGSNVFIWVIRFIFMDGFSTRVSVVLYWTLVLGFGVYIIAVFGSSVSRGELVVKRKLFHILALALFVPPFVFTLDLLRLALGVAFSLMALLEIMRASGPRVFGCLVDSYMQENIDDRDKGSLILTHLYLLAGCALPIWMSSSVANSADSRSKLTSFFACSGLISVGIGDAVGAAIGKTYGQTRWPHTKKTVEGTIAMALSVFLVSWLTVQLSEDGTVQSVDNKIALAMVAVLVSLLEASTDQIDNIVLPIFMFSCASTI